MSIIGGTVCYVDDKRKVVLVHQSETPQTQQQTERTRIARGLRAWLSFQRRHGFVDSIEYRQAWNRIEQFERGEITFQRGTLAHLDDGRTR